MRDWATYDRSLVRRGDITVWVSPDAVAAWREPRGRRTFSDAAIAAALWSDPLRLDGLRLRL